MISGLDVENGVVDIEELDGTAEEIVTDVMSIILTVFNELSTYNNDNEVLQELVYGVLCKKLVNMIEGSL